jgi:molybdopterin-containing oxidoreductase family membrane subunit
MTAGPTTHEQRLLAPILDTSRMFKLSVGLLAATSIWGLSAWIWQLSHGLGVTGMYRPVYWGVYITAFVFFIGISHAGTLISAILRLAKAEWRRPITRMAEVITVMVLFFGVGNVVVDMGRPERFLNVLLHANLRSPLLWDVISISTYLTGSILYLYLPLLPDLSRLRDKIGGWRGRLYHRLSFFYEDTPQQRRTLERAIGVMAVLILPIAISVHTVVSWVFGMTVQPMWHSTIFGPYFVVGAIYSGLAALITFMVVLRRVYGLEDYLKPVHFDLLGQLTLVMTLLWFYFTFAEHLTTFYGAEPGEMQVFWDKVSGRFALPFWTMCFTCFVVPFALLSRRKTRSIGGVLVASISINIGMFLERFTIVVPSLMNPRIETTDALYSPTWVEWSIFAGCLSAFALLYLGFTKLFPIISIWEIEEGIEEGIPNSARRVRSYLPGTPATDAEHRP